MESPEIPAVWLSSAPVWEPSATKGVFEDGIRRQACLAEIIGLCGGLVRIEVEMEFGDVGTLHDVIVTHAYQGQEAAPAEETTRNLDWE